MALFEVDIIETLQTRVEIEADTLEDAVELANERYYAAEDDDYILTADNANVSVEFEGVEDGV